MDLQLSPEQRELESALSGLCSSNAGAHRARELDGGLDRELLEALHAHGFLDLAVTAGASLVDGVIVVEQAEKAFARAPVAARAIIAPLILPEAGLAVGLVHGADALVRYAGLCDTYLFLEDDRARWARAAEVKIEPVPSRWGYPLGRVHPAETVDLGPGTGRRLRSAWQIALAAEMGGQMQAAVGLTARYVSQRRQFGRPIGAFQAVSHRLAQAAVYAEGTTWMARRAAWNVDDPVFAAAAATYACEAAEVVAEATHQVTGAIGITREYDLVLATMRLGVLETELGGAAQHARSVVEARWPS
jgi:alkylation response protein AidB-like acyl-CoA dehydrogenase